MMLRSVRPITAKNGKEDESGRRKLSRLVERKVRYARFVPRPINGREDEFRSQEEGKGEKTHQA
jgi:hypothetical protein